LVGFSGDAVAENDLRAGLLTTSLDNENGYETSSVSSCDHQHLDAATKAGDALGPFEKPSYYVFPPSWSDTSRYWWAQAVIWIPTAMAIPAIILWVLESFTNYRG